MGRKRNKPDYNPVQVQRDMMEIIVKMYKSDSSMNERKCSLRSVADELDISVSKVVKLLITAGEYKSALSEKIIKMYENGESISAIQKHLGISRATVHSYLPYQKGVYSAKEPSLNADRIRRYRERNKSIEVLKLNRDIASLWRCIELFEGYGFQTAKGLKFKYYVKGGEIFVNWKEASKPIRMSTVELALHNALELMDSVGFVTEPKKLGTFGASYLYPMFLRFGIIEVSEDVGARMTKCKS